MENEFVNLDIKNIEQEHICCAISDKKHKQGVSNKKEWLKNQMVSGHVFRKLNQNGKVFIEYTNIEDAFVPVIGSNYIYIYCFWVSGSFKGKGYGKNLIEYAINDAKQKGKDGICISVGKKKLSFLSEKKFLEKYGFKVVDTIEDNYELLALVFNNSETPKFTPKSKVNSTQDNGVVIYYTDQCPYINNCIDEIEEVCREKEIPITKNHVDNVDKAKQVPCFMNNFAVFYNKKFITHELLNRARFIKFLDLE